MTTDAFTGATILPHTPNTTLTFYGEDGKPVGTFDFSKTPITFTGDADAAAQLFVAYVKQHMHTEIADLQHQVNSLAKGRRPFTSKLADQVIKGQVKEIDRLIELIRAQRHEIAKLKAERLPDNMLASVQNQNYEQELADLRKGRDALKAGLNRCADIFTGYAQIHTAKGTEEARLKAERNMTYAQGCLDLIEQISS